MTKVQIEDADVDGGMLLILTVMVIFKTVNRTQQIPSLPNTDLNTDLNRTDS